MSRWRGRCWHQKSHQQGQGCFLQTETCLEINSVFQKNQTEAISKLCPLYAFMWLRMLAYNGTWPQIPVYLPHQVHTNNFKEATVQNYRTRCYEQHLATRRWRWIGHVLRQKHDRSKKNITKMDTSWKKKTWTTKKTWRKTVEQELEQLHLRSWCQSAKQAADRTLVSALYASGHEDD